MVLWSSWFNRSTDYSIDVCITQWCSWRKWHQVKSRQRIFFYKSGADNTTQLEIGQCWGALELSVRLECAGSLDGNCWRAQHGKGRQRQRSRDSNTLCRGPWVMYTHHPSVETYRLSTFLYSFNHLQHDYKMNTFINIINSSWEKFI